MAVPSPNQKLSEDITTTISLKINDHVHFKPNIQFISTKNQNSNATVYSTLSNQSQDQTQTILSQSSQPTYYNSPSIFSNHLGQSENISGGLRVEGNSHIHHNTSAISFNSLPGTRQDNITARNSIAVTYNSSQHTQPPQIFSASINDANLLSSSGGDQIVSGSNTEEKNVENNVSIPNQSKQSFNRGICLGNSNLQIGLPSMTGKSAQLQTVQPKSTSKQHSHVSTSIQYIQSSTAAQYSHASSGIQYVQSTTGYQVSGSSLVTIDAPQTSTGHQQPTYVLLQAPGESGGAPQVFLAMQTTSLSGQDANSQPYITLQPISLDSTDLSNTIVQDGVNLQQAVLDGGDINSDGKSLVSDSGEHVVLNIPGQQTQVPSSTNNGQPSLVTYLQSLGSIGAPVSNMEQGQVIMAASDLQGNVTLHNVASIGTGNKRNILVSSRQSSQVGLTTPRRRLSQDPRSCMQCGRCFKYPSDLKKHLQIHTDIKKFVCEDCLRTFRRLHQLNVHRRIHTGEKPYVCNRCGAQFRHDSTLTMHIRTRHDHLKPFTCDGCSKKFGRMSHLRKHQRNVCGRSGLKGTLAQCKYCEASFTKKSDLKGHFNVCEKKPDRIDKDPMNPTLYPCETCGKEFSRVYDLRHHQLSHSDEKPYGCPQCGKTFKERSSLNKHVKRMHGSDGDGTIPIDGDGIMVGDDDEEELSVDVHEHHISMSCLTDTDHTVSQISTTGVSAEALAQAGIVTSRHEVMTAHGESISATEILNFPEVAEALGINSGARVTLLDSDVHSTIIANTQPDNLETTEVFIDMEQNIQDGGVIETENHDGNREQCISSTDTMQINPVQIVSDSIDVIYDEENSECVIYNSESASFHSDSLGSTMVFKQEDDGEHYTKRLEDLAAHVKAEQAAAHDLQPEYEQSSIISNHMLQEE